MYPEKAAHSEANCSGLILLGMLKFKNFKHFSHSVLKQNVGYQGWNSQNACQNSKQGRP